MLEDPVWRVALLSVVFVTDLVVFIALCREELRDWHAGSGKARAGGAAGNGLPAMAAPSR